MQQGRDLNAIARHLRSVFADSAPIGAVVGRTRLRDAVAAHLASSQLEAEELVDTLVGRGFLALEREQTGQPGVWHIHVEDDATSSPRDPSPSGEVES